MTEINYFQIEEAIAEILRKDERTAKVNDKELKVVVEETFAPMPVNCPWVGIYLTTWDTPEEDEFIGGVKSFRTFLGITLRVYEYSLEHREGAILRDQLLGKIKEVLKDTTNRTLSDTVNITTFAGGEFETAMEKGAKGFYKGVTLVLKVEVRE